MQQILLINGGESKVNFSSFMESLRKEEYYPYTKWWSENLGADLGDGFLLQIPYMPNMWYADYEEWKIMFEKTFPYLEDGIIIVGHSLGTSFLIKFLEENDFPVKIKNIILASTLIDDTKDELLGNFKVQDTLTNFKKYEEKIIFLHSNDDEIAPISQLNDLKLILPNSKYIIYDKRGHFLGDHFPELVECINNIN